MSEIDGLVQLDDLPETEFFIELNKKDKYEIQNLLKSYSLLEKFCKENEISDRIISHWINDGSFLRLDVFKKLVKILKLENIKIKALRGKDRGKIKNPKFPFDFTTISGVRFIGSILGDGSLNKGYEISYANTNKNLIKGFVADSKNIFGFTEINARKIKTGYNSDINIVSLPNICGKILSRVGIKPGRKVVLNQKIPNFIFKLDEVKRWNFLSQLFDDEGTVNLRAKYIRIKLAIESRHKSFHLIKGINDLFKSLEIKSPIYNSGSYTKTGSKKTLWSIQIDGSIKLRKIYENFSLRHKQKEKKFKQLLDSFQLTMFPRHETQDIYLSTMMFIENQKGFFTVLDISKLIDRNIGHIRNMVHKFNSFGLIECIEPYSSGSNEFAKYKVIK